jgi:uncharacterized membrane protein YoaK (UPF0700 family)
VRDHPARDQWLAAALAALAGFIDALGFMASAGYFISFMSGNSTRLAVGLATAPALAVPAASLLLAFVAGVMLATWASALPRRRRLQLGLVGVLLLAAAGLMQAGAIWPALALASAAMGAENCVFEAGGDVRISLTFMTGNLVKVGQRLARAFAGGPRWDWLPWAGLWLAMVGGAVLGAFAWGLWGWANLLAAGAVALVLALVVEG